MEDLDRLSALNVQLAQRLGGERYQFWFGPPTTVEFVADTIRIGVASEFLMQGLKRLLNKTLVSCVEQLWGRQIAIQYHVASTTATDPALVATDSDDESKCNLDGGPPVAPPTSDPTPGKPAPMNQRPMNRQVEPRRPRPPRLQSTFANFVVGKSNELACRTAKSVADQLGNYGPLLLFGPPGVGKTHLMYALLQRVRASQARVRCVRLTAEQFTGEFLDALDRRVLPGFRHKYRTIDVLAIDDIQFLVGKPATLDELLHSIDTLHERGRQVVLTCDRSPGDLQKVSLELVSRISGGLAIPVEMPDYATRLGIVRQQAVRLGIAIDEEIAALVATQVAGSARQLSGAINRLVATSQAHGQPLTADLARTTLVEFVQQNAPAVRLPDIQRAVCEVFGVEPASLKSDRRSRSVVEPRMLAMWLARKYTRSALGEIGAYFGRRSHSTVISAQKKIERLVSDGGEISVADRPCSVEEAIRRIESVLRTA